VFAPRIDPEKCTSCGTCEKICKAEAIDSSSKMIDVSRCVACFDCLSICRFDALKFAVKPKQTKKAASSFPDKGRREFLKKSALGSLLLLTAPVWANSIDPDGPEAGTAPAIPPGAQSLDRFLSKCTGCALCISRCPGQVLQPASFAPYGMKGFGVPFMDFNKGACEYECTLCTTLCPSDAILPLNLEQKKLVKIGESEFVRDYCIVQTEGTSCGACGEICPTGAIEMTYIGDGSDGALEIPKIDNTYCIGCGACQYVCPVPAKNAIFVKAHDRHQTAKLREEAETVEPEEVDNGFAF
jgi:ferredoxin